MTDDNEPKFTPGPWHKKGKRVFWAKPERDLPKDNLFNGLVCICATTEDNPPEVIEEVCANAALIATAPDLDAEIARLDALNRREKTKKVRKLAFPNEVLTAGRLKYLAAHGVEFRLRRGETHYMHDLDKCHTFGGCCLLSEGAAARLAAAERAAAERAAAERAAAERVSLSEREKAIVRALSERSEDETP